jgi:hypothetical protein
MPARKVVPGIQVKMRFRERLNGRLRDAAKTHGVSLTEEVVDRLERSFEREGLWLTHGRAQARARYYNGDLLVMFDNADVDGESGDIAILTVRAPHRERFLEFFRIRATKK